MNQKGQSIIEYTLIAVLVLLGVFFMGPYVLRSVNAHFKLWDEGVRDSFEENLRQAPVNDVPFINTDCNCNAVPSNTCGNDNPGSMCGPNQREVDYVCTIQGCNGAQGNSYCESDNGCCGQPVNEGCGDVPLGQQPLPDNNCYYGQRIWLTQCGSNTTYTCRADSTCPMPSCTGLILNQDQNSTIFCATGTTTPPTYNQINIIQDTPITYVDAATAADCPTTSNNSSCPGYAVTDGSWGSFMNKYGIWPAPAGKGHVFLNMLTSYSQTITIPSTGQYYVQLSSDDTSSVSIDGTVVCSNPTWSTNNYQTSKKCSVSLTAGSHDVVINDTNTGHGGTGTGSWSSNPGGVAVEFLNSSKDALSPAIDTSQTALWSSTVSCPAGQYWDCSSLSCVNGTAPSSGTSSTCTTCPNPSTCQAYCNTGFVLSTDGTGCVPAFIPCMVHDFQLPEPGNGQPCGDGNQASADTVCEAYGYPGGTDKSGSFSDGPYGNDYNFTGTTDSGFNYVFNNHVGSWTDLSCNQWEHFTCHQKSNSLPDNSTVCPGSQGDPSQYYTVVDSCSGSTACQVTCKPNYYAVSKYGPCAPNECTPISLSHDELPCLNGPIPSDNKKTPYTLESSCDGKNPCESYCRDGYTYTVKNNGKATCVKGTTSSS